MQPISWFFAIEGPEDAEPGVAPHLHRLDAAPPAREARGFTLSGGRKVTVLCAGAARAVESARHWVAIIGPRPFDAGLKRALAVARSAGEVHSACTSAAGADCAFLVIDKHAGRLRVITDRLNVSKVFHAEIGGMRLLASHVSAFPREVLTTYPRAVASYVLNGSCLNGGTVFREVTLLDRATVHDFRPDARQGRSYWCYAPGQAVPEGRWRPEAAAAALWELIVQSVARTTSGRRVLLALSGGYDSGVLLGILGAELKHPEVTCFSYVYGKSTEGSDVAVAARQAALYGYRHIALSSYSGDLLGMLDRNAAVGQALRCPSYEIEAFLAAAGRVGDAADSVVLFGDECFGWSSFRLNSANDVLGAVHLKTPALLARLSPAIGAERVEQLTAGLEADYAELRRKTQGFADPDDAKDFLYLDQRLQFNLLPLRTFIAGHWLPVAMPLISPEIIDFVAAVPTAYRVDKRLFRQMARRFLPELFRIPRASQGQFGPDFDQEIAAARRALEVAIAERGWKIDGLVGAEDLILLLSQFCAGASRRGGGRIRAGLKTGARALIVRSRFLEDRQQWLRRQVYNEFTRSPGAWFFTLNLLCLADFLADRPPPAAPSY